MHDDTMLGEIAYNKNTGMIDLADMLGLIASLMAEMSRHYEDQAEFHRDRFIEFTESTDHPFHAGALVGATIHFAKVEALLELMNSLAATLNASLDLPMDIPTYKDQTTLSVWLSELFNSNLDATWIPFDPRATTNA